MFVQDCSDTFGKMESTAYFIMYRFTLLLQDSGSVDFQEKMYIRPESERLLRLPMFYNLDMEQVKRIVDVLAAFDEF